MKLIASIFVLALAAACGGKQKTQPTPQLDDGSGSDLAAGSAAGSGSAGTLAGGPTCAVEVEGKANVDCGLEWFDYFAKRVCACTTQDCAKAVTDDLAAWTNQLPPSVQNDQGTPAQNQRGQELGEQIGTCLGKLYPGADGGDGTTGDD